MADRNHSGVAPVRASEFPTDNNTTAFPAPNAGTLPNGDACPQQNFGDPGAGKSALMIEFERWIAAERLAETILSSAASGEEYPEFERHLDIASAIAKQVATKPVRDPSDLLPLAFLGFYQLSAVALAPLPVRDPGSEDHDWLDQVVVNAFAAALPQFLPALRAIPVQADRLS